MANNNLPNSFRCYDPERWKPIELVAAASYAGQNGDDCAFDSAGRISATIAEGQIAGIQDGLPRDVSKGGMDIVDTPNSETCSAGDKVMVYADVDLQFTGQIASGALADPYTTRSCAACFDTAGSAGAKYVDQSANTTDAVKVIKPFIEPDEGDESAVGAYQKKVFKWSPLAHFAGPVA
jgi:hypothetical protein